MEYMLIVGFSLLVIIPLIIIFFINSGEITERMGYNQVNQIALKIVEASESVYYLGEPSQTMITTNFPSMVSSIALSGKSVVFTVETSAGMSDIVQVSKVNLTGSLSPEEGIHYIRIQATEDSIINVSEYQE